MKLGGNIEKWINAKRALQNVFESSTSIKFVWSDEARTLIRKPFGILSLGNSVCIGRDDSFYDFKENSLEIYGIREVTINVQIFSRQTNHSSSRELIEKARLMISNPIYKDILRKSGLVFLHNNSVVDLNFSYDQRHENRSSFDVVFSMCLHESQTIKDINYFDEVSTSENIKNELR